MRRYVLIIFVLLGAGFLTFFARSALNQPDPILLSAAKAVPVPGQPDVLHIYLTMENGASPNRLLTAASVEAAQARLVGAVQGDIVLPAHSSPSLSSDGVYLEVSGVEGPLEEGRLVPISLEFAPSGRVATRALIGAPADPHAMHVMQNPDGHPQSDPVPEISMVVSPNADDGWDVTLQTAHFTFAPEVPDPIHVPGEGHGHLYLNGLKLQRMYSDTASIGALPPGRHHVEVTLNTNTHQEYRSETGPVVARAIIEVE
ncbi:hypothetical protein [Ruegeria sp.]|uniref:hypothetical protein n=1 Tax=Ruegeria sp. TaxID=1879320 RepID=UPI00230F8271|nr:hypothetical protein [Ruegeria sp.]MDA7966477.1 hypothetical protein [Ruegeria sp.]